MIILWCLFLAMHHILDGDSLVYMYNMPSICQLYRWIASHFYWYRWNIGMGQIIISFFSWTNCLDCNTQNMIMEINKKTRFETDNFNIFTQLPYEIQEYNINTSLSFLYFPVWKETQIYQIKTCGFESCSRKP